MMKILVMGASTSSQSINRRFAEYSARMVAGAELALLDLRDFELPIFSEDVEREIGVPVDAHRFLELIRSHDGIVISMAEHNGSYSAAFKNLYDWTSRIEVNLWSGKVMLLLSTSPGAGGAQFVLQAAQAKFPRMGAQVVASFSLPSYGKNMTEDGIADVALAASHRQAVDAFSAALLSSMK